MKLHGQYLYDPTFASRLSSEFTAASSDKATYHGYHEVYSHLLADRDPKTFLEIGLFLSDKEPHTDLFAWAQVFPDAQIYGADIKTHLLFEDERIKTFFVDQSDTATLDELKKSLPSKIDVILDDASHVYELTVNTFESMFDLVSDGGIYMIEDILFGEYNLDSWEQRVSQLASYFDNAGHRYETFTTSKLDTCVDSVVMAICKDGQK